MESLDWWSFSGTLATLVGLGLTFVALYLSIKQLKRTLDATRASMETALKMSQEQLGLLLEDLAAIRSRIEDCAESDHRKNMLDLLDTWMHDASEVTGYMEPLHARNDKVDVQLLKAQLALIDRSGREADPYSPLYSMLIDSISSAKNTRPKVEQARRGSKLAAMTAVWRASVTDVVNEAAKLQGKSRNYLLRERSTVNGGQHRGSGWLGGRPDR